MTGNVVWKEEFDPSDDLTKLSQYAGAYSAATIYKSSEVSLLLKTKDQEIFSLQAQLSEAQQKAEQTDPQMPYKYNRVYYSQYSGCLLCRPTQILPQQTARSGANACDMSAQV